jgi:6-bladed beta-propeller protein
MSQIRRVLVPVMLVSAVAACESDSGSMNDVATDQWSLVEDLRLGTLDGGGPEQFTQIAGITTDAEGRIYVLDYPSQEIRVFDAVGGYVRTIGRKGQGPGELNRAAGMNFDRDGRLWTWDPGNARFSVFNVDGTFVTSYPRLALGVIYPWRGEFDGNGVLYDWGLDYPDRSETGSVGGRAIFYPLRLSDDFASVDTLPPLEYARQLDSRGERAVPFGRGLTTYQDRKGTIWYGLTDEYRVSRRTMEGDSLLTFSHPATPAQVSASEVDSIDAAMSELPQQFRVSREDIPVSKPILKRIFSDNERWVYVVPELDGYPVGTVVDVFGETGEHEARMEFPQRISHPTPPPHATSDHLYVVVVDEFDVEYVSRLRIIRN